MYRLLLLACLAVVISQKLAEASGRCGTGPRAHSCVADAVCQSGTCVCQAPYVWGDGVFACYKKNTVASEVKMDPMLTTFNNESRPFPFPCRYLVSHVKQQLKDKNRKVIGKCYFKIHAFNAKAKGKFFNHGFDVATKIVYDDGRVIKMSSRHYGIARGGSYQFYSKGTMGEYNPDGPWGNDEIGYNDRANKIKVVTKHDRRNNQLRYEFKKCGLQISLVPYDTVRRRNQKSQPGLSVAINCAMHPQWLSNDQVMGLAPHWEGGSMMADHLKPGLTVEQAMMVRAFTRGFEQNQVNNDNGQCQATGTSLSRCNDQKRRSAFNYCYWMLKEPRFIKCVDKTNSAKKILKLFNMCVDIYCNSGSCSAVQNKINMYGCANVKRIPELTTFMSGAWC